MSWWSRRRLARRWEPILDATVEQCPGTGAPAMFVINDRGLCQACEEPVETKPSPDGRPGDVALPHRRTEP